MDSSITDEQRKMFEDFISKHEPYEDDDPALQFFDNPDADISRMRATTMKKLLTGEIPSHGPGWKPPEEK